MEDITHLTFLTEDEIIFLIVRKRASLHAAQLEKQRIPFKLNAAGKPVVLREILTTAKPKQANSWLSNKG